VDGTPTPGKSLQSRCRVPFFDAAEPPPKPKPERLSATAEGDLAYRLRVREAESGTEQCPYREAVRPEVEVRIDQQRNVRPDHHEGFVSVECPHDAVSNGPFRQ
jgi:hypothetical protein